MGPTWEGVRSGHVRSALAGRALDRAGKEVPWYTQPAIAAISEMDFSRKSVLEFGGGSSTIWWAGKAKHVTCVESNAKWCELIRERLTAEKTADKVELLVVSAPPIDEFAQRRTKFDIVVVDDGSGIGPHGRVDNFFIALDVIAQDGMIILDNSDAPYMRPVMEHETLESNLVVHFWGLAPGAMRTTRTSIMFMGRRPV
jgi:hypothetical protein